MRFTKDAKFEGWNTHGREGQAEEGKAGSSTDLILAKKISNKRASSSEFS
jgi:hypothetical protein